jgi:molecular chaperone GrpE
MNDDDVVFEPEEGGKKGFAGASEEDIEASESRAGAKADKLKKELDTVKKERQEYLDGWQRAKADYVNALKRFEEEKRGMATRSTLKAVETLIPTLISLEKAKEAGDIPVGFQGIVKQLDSAFGSLGVHAIGAVGEAFDPVRHEALGMDPTDKQKQDDTVSVVLEQGYMVGDAVLRPAKVRVFHFE